MLELSAKTNLLEENDYRYSLQDVKDPVLYRDVYNYDEVPKVAFNHRRVPTSMPADIWITDTSFRDGQQSMNPSRRSRSSTCSSSSASWAGLTA